MKYWWLQKYENIKIINLKDLKEEVNYYLTMPKDCQKIYNEIKKYEINDLTEEKLLIILFFLANSKKINDNKLIKVIEKLLVIPDTNLPISDYLVKETLTEIKNLKNVKETSEKLEKNNIGACYNCLNIFYVDKIKYINKNNLCLCPYCKSHHIYFDNDLIPMNYSFLLLAKLFYKKSLLGSTFKDLQKLLKKNIIIEEVSSLTTDKTFDNNYKSKEERYINEAIRKDLNYAYKNNYYTLRFNIKENNISLIFLITLMEYLGNNPYIRTVYFTCSNKKIYNEFINDFKVLTTFK